MKLSVALPGGGPVAAEQASHETGIGFLRLLPFGYPYLAPLFPGNIHLNIRRRNFQYYALMYPRQTPFSQQAYVHLS